MTSIWELVARNTLMGGKFYRDGKSVGTIIYIGRGLPNNLSPSPGQADEHSSQFSVVIDTPISPEIAREKHTWEIGDEEVKQAVRIIKCDCHATRTTLLLDVAVF